MGKNPASDRAIDSLKQRLQRDPLSRAFLQLAEEYRKAGLFEEAIRTCLEGLERHPQDHTARIALGRTYLEAGDLEAAGRTLSEVHLAMPENHLAGKLLAEVQKKRGDRPAAAETYRSILRHYPGDREVETLLRNLLEPVPPAASADTGAAPPGASAAPGAAPGVDPGLDYRPEDIVGATSGAPLDRSAPAPPAPGPARAPTIASEPARTLQRRPEMTAVQAPTRPAADPVGRREPEREEDRDALQTNTLAELYLRQGLVERAMDVYRAMLRVDPGNDRARRRIEELSEVRTTQAVQPPSETAAVSAAPEVERGRGTRDAIHRLERWLQSMRGRSSGASATRAG